MLVDMVDVDGAMPGYDARGTFEMSVAYATADRGGCYQRSCVQADEILGGDLPPDALVCTTAVDIRWRNHTSVKYSGIWCEFWALELEGMRQLPRHACRRDLRFDARREPARRTPLPARPSPR